MQEIIHTVLSVGLAKPVKLLHVTDVHLSYANESDTAEHRDMAESRVHTFFEEGGRPPKTPAEYFEESFRLAGEENALMVCTGDVMDLQTYGNRDVFRRLMAGKDMLFTPGGHEHQKRFVRTMEEEPGYWKQARQRLSEWFPEYPLDFDHRIVHGLNIVMVDNSLDYFNESTVASFRKELDRGLPMIVFAHDPIQDPILNATEKTHPNVPLTDRDYARTQEMLRLIRTHPLVQAFVAGHEHCEQEGRLDNGHPFYVTPGLFGGVCRLIEIR